MLVKIYFPRLRASYDAFAHHWESLAKLLTVGFAQGLQRRGSGEQMRKGTEALDRPLSRADQFKQAAFEEGATLNNNGLFASIRDLVKDQIG
jgi:hypothetical protein